MEIIPELRPDPQLYEYWMLPVFFLSFLILAYVRFTYNKRILQLIRSSLRLQILRQVMREELLFSHRASILLFLNFILSSGMILYAASNYYGLDINGFEGIQRYGIITLAVLLLYLLKFTVILILRWLYSDHGVLREYLYEVFSISKLMGLFLLPLSLILVTVNIGLITQIMSFIAVLVALFLLLRTVQGLILSFDAPVSRIYIILYLCSLEIIPFLLLIGYLKRGMM
jgi:hypothetical protein